MSPPIDALDNPDRRYKIIQLPPGKDAERTLDGEIYEYINR